MDTVGKRLRYYRKTRGWKQDVLATRAGIAQNTVSAIETGARDGTLEVLTALATALEIPVSALVDGTRAPLPGEMPPALRWLLERIGQDLDAEQWRGIAAYAETQAELVRDAEGRTAYGQQAPEVTEPQAKQSA